MQKINKILQYLTVGLLFLFKRSHQVSYTCDPNAPCGCSKDTVTVSRIVGGETASTAAWGWAVSLKIGSSGLCGGSIISSSWVLTAAHCTAGQRASDFTVYAGSNSQWAGTQVRQVLKIINHPSYISSTFENDIALLQLSSSFDFSDPYVSMICLPSISQAILSAGEWPAVGTNLVAVGWGRLTDGGSLPGTLQQVTVQSVAYSASTCKPVMADWHLQFCAGVSGGGKDTCQGDSGGPLMFYNGSNLWVLVGATSSGIGCAEAANSGMYTRIAAFQEWIKSSIDPSYSTLATTPTTTSTTISTSQTKTTTTRFNFSLGNTLAVSIINTLFCAIISVLVAPY